MVRQMVSCSCFWNNKTIQHNILIICCSAGFQIHPKKNSHAFCVPSWNKRTCTTCIYIPSPRDRLFQTEKVSLNITQSYPLNILLECWVFIKRLSNSMYLFTPVFYVFVRAPVGVRRVVSLLLRRDPSDRITADIAVTMLTLVLWAPPDWLHSKHVSVIDIHRWAIDSWMKTPGLLKKKKSGLCR